MDRKNFSRERFHQHYTLTRNGDKVDVGIRTEIIVRNITSDAQPYQAKYHYESGDMPSTFQIHYKVEGKPTAHRTNPFTPSTVRRGIMEAHGDEVLLQPGQALTVIVETCSEASSESSDTISFGAKTKHVSITIDATDGLDYTVDTLRDDVKRAESTWTFRRPFEIEQHVRVQWWRSNDASGDE
jgi:hypothetical protein